jgi:putative alpha-1,2-mannosidase
MVTSKSEKTRLLLLVQPNLALRIMYSIQQNFRSYSQLKCWGKALVASTLVALTPLSSQAQPTSQAPLTHYVDPRIGVVGAGNCIIGPTLPFGSVHPSPDTPDGDHDGYHPDRPIRGFSQTHVSGTGWGQYGNILISPQVGLAVGETEHDSPKADERPTAYDYRVRLTKYDVLTEFTPAARSVFYQFTFPRSDEATIAIDVSHSIPENIATYMNGKVKDGEIKLAADRRSASGFGGGIYKVYFFAEMNRAARSQIGQRGRPHWRFPALPHRCGRCGPAQNWHLLQKRRAGAAEFATGPSQLEFRPSPREG